MDEYDRKDASEAATALGLSTEKVIELCRKGALDSCLFATEKGDVYLIEESEVWRWQREGDTRQSHLNPQ